MIPFLQFRFVERRWGGKKVTLKERTGSGVIDVPDRQEKGSKYES